MCFRAQELAGRTVRLVPGLQRWLACVWALTIFLVPSRAELQFDVFLGFDDHVREGHWFPIAFEVFNDGPSFNGSVVVGTEGGMDAQQRSFNLELPTGTRKRIVIPAFSASGRYARWDARLLDRDGKLVAERTGLQARDTAMHVPLLGALPRTFGGLPTLPEFKNRTPEFAAAVARLQTDYLPANPIALEALTAWYLNSEKAADLRPEQADALLAWVHDGGHLVVGIEQPGDINALPWLRALLPFAPQGITNRPAEGCFERWLVGGKRVLQLPALSRRPAPSSRVPGRAARVRVDTPVNVDPQDPFARIEPQNDFNNAEVPIIVGRQLDGEAILSLGEFPLIISAPRGRGTVTVLAFSPEREPLRSWKNRAWFWAKLIAVPPELLTEAGAARWSGSTTLDGWFGAMLDSRQVRKLPVPALLLLLVVYLVVIGPFDQWILKRTGRQMWTWVTFPLYVVLFSGLIYFIGYRLRAGDLELSELQVVDQLPRGEAAALRGRTWLSIYSPGNARYRLVSEQPFATFRSELQQGGAGRAEAGRLSLHQPSKGFEAEAFVPVWVSQLYASDWLEAAPTLITGRVTRIPTGIGVALENRSALRFTSIKVAVNERLYDLGGLGPGERADRELATSQGRLLDEFLVPIQGALAVVQQRRFAFGSERSGRLDLDLDQVILGSFVDRARDADAQTGENFAGPAGFDVNHLVQRGEAVVFAWAPDQAVAPPIHRFTPTRLHRNAVVRVALPAGPSS